MREDAQHLVNVKVKVRVGVGVRVGARLGLRVRVRNAQHRRGQCGASLATGVRRHRRAALVPGRTATGATALAALTGGAAERPRLPLACHRWRDGDGGITAAIVILRDDEGGRLQGVRVRVRAQGWG